LSKLIIHLTTSLISLVKRRFRGQILISFTSRSIKQLLLVFQTRKLYKLYFDDESIHKNTVKKLPSFFSGSDAVRFLLERFVVAKAIENRAKGF